MTEKEFINVNNLKIITHALLILQTIYPNGEDVIDRTQYIKMLEQLQRWQWRLQEQIEKIELEVEVGV